MNFAFIHEDGPVFITQDVKDLKEAIKRLASNLSRRFPNEYSDNVEDYKQDIDEGVWVVKKEDDVVFDDNENRFGYSDGVSNLG